MSGATRAITLDTSKDFDRVWHAGLHKLKYYGISGQIFDEILKNLEKDCYIM